MDELLAAIVAEIAEVLLEIASELLLSLFARIIGKLLTATIEHGPVAASIGVAFLGAASGALSLAIFPHPLVHPSRIHGMSLIASPFITGLVMSQIGHLLRRRGKRTIRIESFGYGFLFAFAMAVIRLAYAK